MTVAVYQIANHHRSQLICDAMAHGIRATGDRVLRFEERHYGGMLSGDVAVFYGLTGKNTAMFADYQRERRAVYVDLGYFGRRDGGRWAGYHKVVVNSRHPTAYFQARPHDPGRAKMLHVEPRPWRAKGGHILLAGMGDKGAKAEGFEPEEWERWAIAELRRFTMRPIVYRPKPSWKRAKPIQGVGFSPATIEAAEALRGAWAVVTHHSNVAVDGLVAGIPAFCWYGVAAPMSSQDLSKIETPLYPDGRAQWLADIAWCQWNIAEMKTGLPWRHLKAERLI